MAGLTLFSGSRKLTIVPPRRKLRIFDSPPSQARRCFSGPRSSPPLLFWHMPQPSARPVPLPLASSTGSRTTTVSRTTTASRTTTTIRTARQEITQVTNSTAAALSAAAGSTPPVPNGRRLRIRTPEETARRRAGSRAPRDSPLTEDEVYIGPERPPAESYSELHECGICFNIQSHPVW
jgi:hypothetical protein